MPTAGPRLLGPAEVRQLAAELDLRPTKQRGQNFVIDANTVRRIVREAGVGPDDVVLEVGPGLGSLTLALLEVGARVVAIEIDERLATRLPVTVAEHAPGSARPAPRRRRPTRCASPRSPGRRRPPWSRTSRTTSPSRSCSTSSRCCPRSSAASSWCRPRWPTGSPPARARRSTASRRSRPPGSPTYVARAPSAVTCSGPSPTSTQVWSRGYAVTRPPPPRRASRCSRSSTRRSPSAARVCAARCGGWPAPPRRPRRPWPLPASPPWSAVSR